MSLALCDSPWKLHALDFMTKHEKRIPVKPPGTCIFCRRTGDLSKEHLWSSWMADLFPNEAVPTHHEVLSISTHKVVPIGPPKVVTRQGGTITKKLRVVCETCNSGWMSALEDHVRPILTPLILGHEFVLNRDQQRILTEWVSLKMMIAEHNVPDDVVVRQEDRDRFFSDRTIPPYFHIWVISSRSEKWRSRYIRHNATFSLPTNPPTSARKNTQTIAWGVGSVFIYVMMSVAEGLDLTKWISVHPVVLKLYPYAGDLLPLPFFVSIDDAMGDRLASSLDELIKAPNVLWKDLPASHSTERRDPS